MAKPKQVDMGFKPEYESKEELLFSYYLSEAQEKGFIDSFEYQPEAFVLTPDLFVHAFERKRDYNNPKKVKLLHGAKYTADFKIVWNKSAEDYFYWKAGGDYLTGFHPYRKNKKSKHIPFFAKTVNHKPTTYVDVKGNFSSAHGLAKFSVVQKWLLAHYDTFIQKVVVSLDEKGIFYKTFTPRQVVISEVYQKDCKHGKKGESKLKYEPILLEKWKKLEK